MRKEVFFRFFWGGGGSVRFVLAVRIMLKFFALKGVMLKIFSVKKGCFALVLFDHKGHF